MPSSIRRGGPSSGLRTGPAVIGTIMARTKTRTNSVWRNHRAFLGLAGPVECQYCICMDIVQRKMVLEMARCRARTGSGSLPPGVREDGARYEALPDLSVLDGLPWVLVGGLATALYMPQRNTLDVDVLVSRADLPRAEERLAESGARRVGPLSIGGSAWTLRDGTPLDLIALEHSWVREALDEPVSGPSGTPFVRLPYLVLMKLESGRLQDLADISRMLGCADAEQLTAARQAVARHRPQDAEDLESMLQLGRMEHLGS